MYVLTVAECLVLSVLALVSNGGEAILAGGQQLAGDRTTPQASSGAKPNNFQDEPTTKTVDQSLGGAANQTQQQQQQQHSSETQQTNTTFYYEADTFLLNKHDDKTQAAATAATTEAAKPSKVDADQQPASVASTSGRSGRMLDLDALVGDFAASQANRARQYSQSGNRQSRFMPYEPSHESAASGRAATLDVGNGKRLQIQGFIPIVGVKDVTGGGGGGGGDESNEADQFEGRPSIGKKSNNDELLLPYGGQSSIGHASFVSPARQAPASQVDAKFSGAAGSSVVETLKRPLKKLTRYGETQHQLANNQQRQQPASGQCLCVPFYMCKGGFISESSLGRSQIQQMILNQQQQQQAQPKAAQLTVAAAAQSSDPYAAQAGQFATYSAQVDERSLDRDIITMAPLTSANEFPFSNQTSSDAEQQQQPQVSLAANNYEGDAMNSTSNDDQQQQQAANDYSQDILGRMLALKSSISKSSSGAAPAGESAAGVCGLLRTCCQIPASAHLAPPHQDSMMGESAAPVSFLGGGSQQLVAPNRYPVRPQASHFADMMTVSQQKQQHHQHQNIQLSSGNSQLAGPQRLYGFPSQISRMQPLNSPNSDQQQQQQLAINTALAHRSNMFPQSSGGGVANRFQTTHPSQPADFMRAPQQMQYLPQPTQPMVSMTHHGGGSSSISTSQQQHQQQQQHQSSAAAAAAAAAAADQAIRMASALGISMPPLQQPTAANEPASQQLGTRKILEGRCGLRQSAGINGRVQNLQYHESSADFGEYPAQAAILKRLSGSDSMFVCGGTLISQYWVATAAHCIKKHSISDLKIRLGEWDVHRDDEFYPFVEKGIRDLVVHSEFVAGNLVNDLALLRLDSPIDATLPHVNPACLPAVDESFTGQKCWVTGWGKDSFGQRGSFQTVLQEVELPVVGQAECESALRQTRLGPHYRLHSGFICAGGEGGRDACEGDGGSGLYCMQDGLIKVAGLVSWGIGCGQQGVPGVYVNLAHYRPWIENIISIDEDLYGRSSSNSSSSSSSPSSASASSSTETATDRTMTTNSVA